MVQTEDQKFLCAFLHVWQKSEENQPHAPERPNYKNQYHMRMLYQNRPIVRFYKAINYSHRPKADRNRELPYSNLNYE
jgi:hypothetical protein